MEPLQIPRHACIFLFLGWGCMRGGRNDMRIFVLGKAWALAQWKSFCFVCKRSPVQFLASSGRAKRDGRAATNPKLDGRIIRFNMFLRNMSGTKDSNLRRYTNTDYHGCSCFPSAILGEAFSVKIISNLADNSLFKQDLEFTILNLYVNSEAMFTYICSHQCAANELLPKS